MSKDASGLYTAEGRMETAKERDESIPQAREELQLTDEELVDLCRSRVCPECPEKAQASDERLRMLAEMDNFRKRMAREQEETRKFAAESVLADLLPVLDNLDLALQHGQNIEACKNLLMGVEMTRKALLDTVKQHGLMVIGEKGEVFDPEWHEAMGHELCPDMDPGCIASVYQKGYKLRERLLRPARVIVSKKD